MVDTERTLELLRDLIGYPTVSSDSNLDLIDFVADMVDKNGGSSSISTNESGTKANLFATFGPAIDGGLVLSGHTDVVPVAGQDWTRDPFQMEMDGSRVWGRGATDMKGFVACALTMIENISPNDLQKPVHLAFTYDEEVGCLGAPILIADMKQKGIHPAVAIVGEPTEMAIAVAHKGCYEYTTTFTALEQHGSLGTRGAGAISAAGRFAGLLDDLGAELESNAPDDSLFDPVGTTINMGTIRGGVARNITPGSVVLEWEMRPVRPEDHAHVIDRTTRFVEEDLLPGMKEVFPTASVKTESLGEVDGLLPEPAGEAVSFVKGATGADSVEAVSFCTEAGLFQKEGISTVVCGPGNIQQAHKPDEFIEIAQLDSCLSMMKRLTGGWSG